MKPIVTLTLNPAIDGSKGMSVPCATLMEGLLMGHLRS